MEVLTFEEYYKRYKKDYGTVLSNKLRAYLSPLHGRYHMNKRKVVNHNNRTVTLYDLYEETP